MQQRTVKLSDDHLSRQAACSPERAIEELIWNGLDAGGNKVEVRFELDDLRAVSAVEVQDWGAGIPEDNLNRAFGTVGDSLKNKVKATPEGRSMHGSEGRGRFRALVLGDHAVWQTTYNDGGQYKSYQIVIQRSKQKSYSHSEPQLAKRGTTGTTVRVSNIDKGELSLTSGKTREYLTEHLALYLLAYQNVSVIYDGEAIDPKPLIRQSRVFDLEPLVREGPTPKIEIIEWKFTPTSRKLLICDLRGFAWHELAAGTPHRGIDFTAFLRVDDAKDWADSGRFARGELDAEINNLVEQARGRMREYVRARLAEDARDLVQQWKDEKIYPYSDDEPQTPIRQAERQVFDIVASKVHQFHSPFRQGDVEARQLTLGLVRQALESNPTSLKQILDKTLKLSKEQQDELADILRRTDFPSLIEAAKIVETRLRALKGFRHILFDDDWKATLLERTQLHRLLVRHVWLFGDEYTLDTDDEELRTCLKKHIGLLGREELAPEAEVKLIDGKDGIPDVMLSRRFKRDRQQIEHLILELKRPAERLGEREISQIKKYAYTVSADSRFSKTEVAWRFILLGNELDDFARQDIASDNLPYGCVHRRGNVSVWVQEWGSILHEAEQRYEFFRDKLNVEASSAEGLAYLKQHYQDLISGRGLTKKADVAKHGPRLLPGTPPSLAPSDRQTD